MPGVSESLRKSPNIIARLMGLDGLLPQQPSHKQQARSSEKKFQRKLSIEKREQNSTPSRWSSRKSSKEEQEFKDVFEVLDSVNMGNESYSSQGTSNLKFMDPEMAYIQQKFMDAERLSTEGNLEGSNLDSNNDLLLRFLQQDTLFTKHVHDLRVASPQSHCGQGYKRERQTPSKNRRKSRGDLSVKFDGKHAGKHAARNPVKPSKVQLQSQDDPHTIPTRIVVLKPNIGREQDAVRAVSSPCSSHDFLSNFSNNRELPEIKHREKLSGETPIATVAGSSRHKSRESRAIAKEITRQMKSSLADGSMNLLTPRGRGYAADVSSPNMSENESACESDATTTASFYSVDWSHRYRPLSCRSAESSVSREARKRLSERWKMTHKSVDMGVANRSSTLGEMLVISDWEVRLTNEKSIDQKVCRSEGPLGTEPLGISSRDGWKDVGIRNLRRSRSVPASSTAISSSTRGTRHEALCNDKYVTPKEVIQRDRNRVTKGSFNQRESSSAAKLKSRAMASDFLSCTSADLSNIYPSHSSKKESQSNQTGNTIHVQRKQDVSGTSAGSITDTELATANVVMSMEDVTMPPESADSDSSVHIPVEGNSSPSELNYPKSQELADRQPEKVPIPTQQPMVETESPASSKETEQPSPVSVLETSCLDDQSSGSECFESLSADLHGLRMQLQLLKSESEAYEEGPMLVYSEEDEEGPTSALKEKVIVEDSKEKAYIINVLVDSGIDDSDPDTFISTWHSSECPVNPVVYEELEKKFLDGEVWLRSDRRLLFDRINAALLLIYQQFVDPHAWVHSVTSASPRWMRKSLQDELLKLLSGSDKKPLMSAADKVLGSESQWLDLGSDIDVICREIERMLIEDLVEQVVEV